MTKKVLNQNDIYVQKLIDTVEPDFVFSSRPVDRFSVSSKNYDNENQNKYNKLLKLKEQINSIEDCNLKDNSTNLVIGDGNINSSIMLIGEAPGEIEDKSGHSFQGDIGSLLKKMLSAININIEKVY